MRCRPCLLLPWLAVACAAPPRAPAPTAALREAIAARVAAFRGTAGVYVRHLGTGAEVAIAADEVFPTASLVKVPILAALLARVARGELDYHQQLTYTEDRRYPGEDLLGSFAAGSTVELAKVAMLSITTSDNTAALWCQELAGGGAAINAWLDAEGFPALRVNSRTPGREAAREQFGWGQTTPRAMAELLVRMHQRRLHDAAVSEELHRCLSRSYWDAEALSVLPPEIAVASKQGAVNRSRSEVALVHAPHGPFVFCAITRDQQDQSWAHGNEGYVLLRELMALCWRHFEPATAYTPPAGMARFW